MKFLRTALHAVGRLIRRTRDWASGDDLYEAQKHRGDEHEHRVNPGVIV